MSIPINPPAAKRIKAALLINMIAPARLPLFSALADHFDLLILHGGREANRSGWQGVEGKLPNARVRKAWGWQIPVWRTSGGFRDRRYVHITPGFLWQLFRFRPDVVIANEMGFRALAALLYGTLMRKPVWIWWGGTLHTERATGSLRRFLRAVIARWARHWISYGHTSTEYLESIGIPRTSIVEIQNSVDERRFQKPAPPAFAIRPWPVLLCVGSLIARKGLEALLRSAAILQREGLVFSLLFVGSGPDRQVLERHAAELGLQSVHFQRECRSDDMPSVYRSGNVLICPTLEDVWGMVANEAVLSGIPVLCSKYAGCAPELFPPENIFDPLDAQDFTRKLRAAVAGELAGPDPSRLKSTPTLARELIQALESSLPAAHALRARHNEDQPARVAGEISP